MNGESQTDRDDLETLHSASRARGFLDRYFRPFAAVMLALLALIGSAALVMFTSHVQDIGDKRWVQIEHYENQRLLDLKNIDVMRANRDAQVARIDAQGSRTENAINDLNTRSEARYDKLLDAIDRLREARYSPPPGK